MPAPDFIPRITVADPADGYFLAMCANEIGQVYLRRAEEFRTSGLSDTEEVLLAMASACIELAEATFAAAESSKDILEKLGPAT